MSSVYKFAVGEIVENVQELRTATKVFPAGLKFEVARRRNGYHLTSPPCRCWGVSRIISGVGPSSLKPAPVRTTAAPAALKGGV